MCSEGAGLSGCRIRRQCSPPQVRTGRTDGPAQGPGQARARRTDDDDDQARARKRPDEKQLEGGKILV